MKHTPGPWHRNIRANGKYPIVFAGRNQHIAQACQQQDPAETESNIDLIATAPELLELAEAFLSYLQDDSRSERRRHECIAACQEALARIKGKP